MLTARILQVIDLSVSWKFAGAAFRIAGLTTKQETLLCLSKTCATAHAESSLNWSRQIIDSD